MNILLKKKKKKKALICYLNSLHVILIHYIT